jgi:hypothetical protein
MPFRFCFLGAYALSLILQPPHSVARLTHFPRMSPWSNPMGRKDCFARLCFLTELPISRRLWPGQRELRGV